MTCQEFRRLLPGYPDDLPSGITPGEVEAHAAECRVCAAALKEHQDLLADLNTLDDTWLLPETFASGWREAVRKEAEAARPRKRPRFRGWAAAAAAAVCVLVGGTALMRGGLLFPGAMPVDGAESAVQPQRMILEQGATAGPGTEGNPVGGLTPVDEAPALPQSRMAQSYETEMAEEAFPEEVIPEEAPMAAAMTGDALDNAPQDADGLAAMPRGTGEHAVFYGIGEQAQPTAPPRRVILQSAAVTYQTEDMPGALAALEAAATELGAQITQRTDRVIDDDSGTTREARVDLRVPTEAEDALLGALGETAAQVQLNTMEEDVSAEYQQALNTVAENRILIEHLSRVAAQAPGTQRASEAQAQLALATEAFTAAQAQKEAWDEQTQMTEVSVSLLQPLPVSTASPQASRLQDGLRSVTGFVSDMGRFIVRAWPWLLGGAAILGGIWLAVRSMRSTATNEKEKRK